MSKLKLLFYNKTKQTRLKKTILNYDFFYWYYNYIVLQHATGKWFKVPSGCKDVIRQKITQKFCYIHMEFLKICDRNKVIADAVHQQIILESIIPHFCL